MSDSEVVLPAEYDNVFVYGKYLYVLHKGGKISAIRFEDEDLSYRTVAETKYDTLDFYWHDMLFSNGDEFVYYYWLKLQTRHLVCCCIILFMWLSYHNI